MKSLVTMFVAAVMVLCLLGSSCTTETPPQPKANAVKVSADGGLKVSVRKSATDGSVLRMSGTVVNRYDKPVEGVRYTVQMIIPGTTPRILNTSSRESDLALESGETKPFSLEIENPIYASASAMFSVDATPAKLGGSAVPPPAGWVQPAK